ncbi:MAG: hypothetical protein ACRDAX_09885 [Propionibacteriaceae bacterium]
MSLIHRVPKMLRPSTIKVATLVAIIATLKHPLLLGADSLLHRGERILLIFISIIFMFVIILSSNSKRHIATSILFPFLLVGSFFVRETPQRYYALHKVEFYLTEKWIEDNNITASKDYTVDLPIPLKHFSATGSVYLSRYNSALIPRWVGMPDDAGGYVYATSDPGTVEALGSICRAVHIDGNWWHCGMTFQ